MSPEARTIGLRDRALRWLKKGDKVVEDIHTGVPDDRWICSLIVAGGEG